MDFWLFYDFISNLNWQSQIPIFMKIKDIYFSELTLTQKLAFM